MIRRFELLKIIISFYYPPHIFYELFCFSGVQQKNKCSEKLENNADDVNGCIAGGLSGVLSDVDKELLSTMIEKSKSSNSKIELAI
jgi:hypothetical protein